MDIERTITPYLKKISREFPVFLLSGMRQIGKSYILEKIREKSRKYVSLDDLAVRQFAIRDPKGFIEQNPPPVIIDEVQYAPELFTYIKIYVDSHPKRNGLFWLSGSQKFHLMKGIRESLAGRVAIIDMLGLSYKEINKQPFYSKPFLPSMDLLTEKQTNKLSVKQVYTHIWKGSFPKPITEKTDRDAFYRGYLRTYIERDIRDDLGLTNEIKFLDFIRAVASRTGNLLNYQNIASDIGIDNRTVKKWTETLVRTGLVYILQSYSTNINRRLVLTPKIYFLDTGLAAYLTKWDNPSVLMNGALSGSILETYVFAEILKSYWHNGKEESIYFYRDRSGKEIDFVIEKNGTLYPIEVKRTSTPNTDDFKNFSTIRDMPSRKPGTGAIICLYPSVMPIAKDVLSVPVWSV